MEGRNKGEPADDKPKKTYDGRGAHRPRQAGSGGAPSDRGRYALPSEKNARRTRRTRLSRDGSRVVHLSDYKVVPCDQILVGRNVTRRNINSGLRERYGLRGTYPLGGDKLVCLRNDFRRGFLNGSLWIVERVIKASDDGPIVLRVVSEEGGAAVTATTHAGFFNGRPILDPREYVNFDFGYALTVHKAQGSQWDDVVLHGEQNYFGDDARRWLYTGLTRAAKRIIAIKR
jgi:UvrD-like helicase C-terminal domain